MAGFDRKKSKLCSKVMAAVGVTLKVLSVAATMKRGEIFFSSVNNGMHFHALVDAHCEKLNCLHLSAFVETDIFIYKCRCKYA